MNRAGALLAAPKSLEFRRMAKTSERVVVGMSGGVDSSVAALCLKEAGLDVHGLFMHNWEDDEEGYCTSAEDFQDARRVSETLAIPLHRVDFTRAYRDRVFRYFLDEYSAGRTPNPDVLCNREIKFGEFLKYAKRLGAGRIATGHYARLGTDGTRVRLRKAIDPNKDQSYFLHAVPAEALSRSIFPVGGLLKSEVRALAKANGFHNFARKDSTGICFIGERHFGRFLANYLPAQPGPIVAENGKEIGRHNGLMYYTIGQRQGLGLGGQADLPESPWYVAAKDMATNSLLVVQGHDHRALLSSTLVAADVSWMYPDEIELPLRCTARIRYRQTDQACHVESRGEAGLRVRFDQPQRAVAAGQFVVFYNGDDCLGGGAITGSDASIGATYCAEAALA